MIDVAALDSQTASLDALCAAAIKAWRDGDEERAEDLMAQIDEQLNIIEAQTDLILAQMQGIRLS